MNKKNEIILSLSFGILTLFFIVGTSFSWFQKNDYIHTDGINISTMAQSNISISNYSFFKFNSTPSILDESMFLSEYDYEIPTNNLINNLLVLIEVEVEGGENEYSLKTYTDNDHQFAKKNFLPCNSSSTYKIINNGANPYITYFAYNVNNVMYYQDNDEYIKCGNGNITIQDNQYYYNGYPTYYFTYYLTDFLDFQISLLDYRQFKDLNDKQVVGGLSKLTNFYSVLNSFFKTQNSYIQNSSFLSKINGNYILDNSISYKGTFNMDFLKVLNSKNYAYFAMNIKYSSAMEDESLGFDKTINQLFFSNLEILFI